MQEPSAFDVRKDATHFFDFRSCDESKAEIESNPQAPAPPTQPPTQSSPTLSPTLSPTRSPTSSPISSSPTLSPTLSPTDSPTRPVATRKGYESDTGFCSENGLQFDGDDDYLRISPNVQLGVTNTISMRVKYVQSLWCWINVDGISVCICVTLIF